MKRIFIPTQSPSDWQPLLAKPASHWKKSYSAMTTAACWEEANGDLPAEVKRTLETSGQCELEGLKLLAAIPEWEVALPGGQRPSHTDVLAFASNKVGLVVIGVEAKVDEPFGPTLGEKRLEPSNGQDERIHYLHSVLGLERPMGDEIRYQLLHRTVSTIRTAQDFHASSAVMLVHSFSPKSRWREDFSAFCSAMGTESVTPDLFVVTSFNTPRLYLAWCAGNTRFLDVELPSKLP